MKSSAPVAKYLLEFKKKYKKKGKKVVEMLVQKLEAGEDVEQAIRETIEVTHFQDMLDQDTKNAIAASTAAGMGRMSIPLLPEMETPWDPSELTLSEKLHSIHREIHQKIGNIVQQQVRLHNHASDIRKALYDGYNGQKTEAVLQQELPQYIKGAVDFIRRTPFEKTDKECRLRLIRRIERQAKALTSKPLKTAYKELAMQLGKNNEDGLKRAVYVAVQEKSRYVAERIARTESARAWADGFIARYENDDTVAAYRWEVSSAHPCTDVCDMYANADLWGLGKGIYSKDQCPTLPSHPHCLCYLSPIYEGEVDLNEQQDLREEGGNHWLQKQSKDVQRQLLGVQGAKAWEAGRPWQDVLRNYSPTVMKSRVIYLSEEQGKVKRTKHVEIETITDELKKRKRSPGELIYDKDYDVNKNRNEVIMAQWLYKRFGGNIKLLTAVNEQNKKTPDYLWNGKYWDLKSISSEKAADSAIRHGLKQIEDNHGGLILNYVGEFMNIDKLCNIVCGRLKRGIAHSGRIIVVYKGKIVLGVKYTEIK